MTAARKLRDPEPGEPLGYGQGSLSWDRSRPGVMVLKYAHGGKRYAERGRSWAEVDGKRRDRLARLVERAGLVDGSVAALCGAWFTFVCRWKGEALSRHTESGYRRSVERISGSSMGRVPAAELNRGHVRELLADLAHEPGLSRRTLYQLRNHLSMACEYGIEHRWMTANPAEGVAPPDAAALPRAKRWYDLVDYLTVRAWLVEHPSTTSTLFLVMLDAGLRPGEANGLRWDAVDFETGTLAVESAMRLDRQGRRVLSSTLKTDRHGDAARRVIPLTPELATALRRERSAVVQDIGGRVFPEVTKSALDTGAHRIARAAGVPYVNPNGYRHTFASICRHRGMPYEVLARLMGHTSAEMIIRTYGHPVVDPAALDMRLYLGADAALPYVEGEGE